MRVLILIEPTEQGGFRARAGEPFALSAEGVSAHEATCRLEGLLQARLHAGASIQFIDLNGGASGHDPLNLTPVPADDWFFRAMREAIEENRKQEDAGAE